jgi:hypothetical protein
MGSGLAWNGLSTQAGLTASVVALAGAARASSFLVALNRDTGQML